MNYKKGLPTSKLNSLLEYWQKRLLLEEWNLSIDIVEFNRKDYRQSGDIKVFPKDKKAIILLTNDPFKDEEKVLVHELVHLILWDFDIFSEKFVLDRVKSKLEGAHGEYMEKLESTVEHLTNILLQSK